jgi:hypothetical protein
MGDQPTVRVVVGEAAEPSHGVLRFVLDGEGFDVVGEGSTPAELERILSEAQPAVVVLGADISVTAVRTVRKRAPFAKVIVVWPAGVSAALADDRVEPSRIYDELGGAVRRQADRRLVSIPEAAEPIDWIVRLREAEAEAEAETEPALEPSFEAELEPEFVANGPANPARRSARALVGVACFISLVILMIGAAFALEGSKRSAPSVEARTSKPSPSLISRSAGGSRDEGKGSSGSNCEPGPRARGNDQTPHVNRGDRGNHRSGCGAQGRGHQNLGTSKGNNGHHRQGGAHHARSQGTPAPPEPPNQSGHANDPIRGLRHR